MTQPNYELWDTIIEDLRGSCQNLDEPLENYDAFHLEHDMDFLNYLDDRIFCCESCGWWYEISEQSDKFDDRLICENCEENY